MASHRGGAYSSAYEALGDDDGSNLPGAGDPEGQYDPIICEGKRLQVLNISLTKHHDDIMSKLSSTGDREARRVLTMLNVELKKQNGALAAYVSQLVNQNRSLREMLKTNEDGQAAINMQKAAELLVKALANAEEEVQGLKATLKEVTTQRDKYKERLANVNAELKSSDAHARIMSMTPPQGGGDITSVSPTKFPSTSGLHRGSGAHTQAAAAGRHPQMSVSGGGTSTPGAISSHDPQAALVAGLQGQIQPPSRRPGGAAGRIRQSTGFVGGSSEAHGSRHSGTGILIASSGAASSSNSTVGMVSQISTMWERSPPDVFGIMSNNNTGPGASGIARSELERVPRDSTVQGMFGSGGLKGIDDDVLDWAVEESKGTGSKDTPQVGLPDLTGAYHSDDEPSMFF